MWKCWLPHFEIKRLIKESFYEYYELITMVGAFKYNYNDHLKILKRIFPITYIYIIFRNCSIILYVTRFVVLSQTNTFAWGCKYIGVIMSKNVFCLGIRLAEESLQKL